ncbi:MAG: insulinase family protein [Candidatus Solibacter usitatus]|nr:insulinase family protein [Candidatus Solibacter usitatus]
MKPFLSLILFFTSLAAADLNIPFEKYTLPNGLRVILSPDNTAPVVTVYVIYGVGARSEEKGRTGFAHLFEHMMFQGSAHAPKGTHFQAIESNGGTLNGSTHPDYTDYFEILPANKLAVALWLESDRMRSLAITKENLDNQTEAVKQERRLSFDNQPYATAVSDVFPALAYKNWSSAHSIIGSFEDLNAAGVNDVSRFFRTHYAPNNAVLSIAGDIRKEEVRKLIEAYFGDIPRQERAKSPDLTEPERKNAEWQTYKDPLARVPLVMIAYPGPKRRSPDYYAITMLDVVFTTGDSSRLYQSMVKEKKSALAVEGQLGGPFGGVTDYKDPGLYTFNLTYNPSLQARQVVEQFEQEIARMQTQPPSAKEMERARATMRSFRVRSLQSTMTRAQLLAQYELLDGKPELLNSELEQFLAVTPRQIQEAAKKYLVKSKQCALEIIPAAPAEAKQ